MILSASELLAQSKNTLVSTRFLYFALPILSTHNDGLNRGIASTTNLAPMTSEFYPIMEQVRRGRKNIPCRENLAKQKATLSNAVKC